MKATLIALLVLSNFLVVTWSLVLAPRKTVYYNCQGFRWGERWRRYFETRDLDALFAIVPAALVGSVMIYVLCNDLLQHKDKSLAP